MMAINDLNLDEIDPEYERELELEELLNSCLGKFDKDDVFWCELAGTNDCEFNCPNGGNVMKSRAEIDTELEKE